MKFCSIRHLKASKYINIRMLGEVQETTSFKYINTYFTSFDMCHFRLQRFNI